MRRFLTVSLVLVCLISLAACGNSSPGYIMMIPEGSTEGQTTASTALSFLGTNQTQTVLGTIPPVTTVPSATMTLPVPDLSPTQPPEAEPVGIEYVLNTGTKKFHYPTCSSVKQMKDKNKACFTGTREALLAQGYSPCGRCHP